MIMSRPKWRPLNDIEGIVIFSKGENPITDRFLRHNPNHPELAKSWLVFATHVLFNNSIPERERELLILRIGWLCQSEYEWGQHVRIGKAAGLTHEDIVRIMAGPDAQGISNLDKLLLQAADELHKSAVITDATWEVLAEIYDTQQMMDVVFTVGQYNLVSMALNSFGVQLDEGIAGF
jgi:4-carboxymuconolactone decarboxylase